MPDTAMHIFVVDHEGAEHRLEAVEGWRVMEIIRDWGIAVKAECGGACACGTCHVFLDKEWTGRVPPASDEEIDQLDGLPVAEANSRLSCQILMAPHLSGMRVVLAPGSEAQ